MQCSQILVNPELGSVFNSKLAKKDKSIPATKAAGEERLQDFMLKLALC